MRQLVVYSSTNNAVSLPVAFRADLFVSHLDPFTFTAECPKGYLWSSLVIQIVVYSNEQMLSVCLPVSTRVTNTVKYFYLGINYETRTGLN